MTDKTELETLEAARAVMFARSQEMEPFVLVFGYDPSTGVFRGPVKAFLSPLECEYPAPANTLDVSPPHAPEQYHVWRVKQDLSGWEQVVDFVGVRYWLADGSHHEIQEYGVAIPADALMEQPQPAEPEVAEEREPLDPSAHATGE